jgi:hemerythrin superfamily protein
MTTSATKTASTKAASKPKTLADKAGAKQTSTKSKAAGGKSGGGLALAAGAGLAAGLAANVLRKVVVQAPTVVAGNWSDALAAEHKATLLLFDKLDQTTEKQTTKRGMLLMQIKHALTKHAVQEENVVYPSLRQHGATDEADHLNHDHGYVKQYLFELDMLAKDDAGWLPKVRDFRALLEKHMDEEENVIFPRLRGQLSDEQNKIVTAAMNKEGLKIA